MTFASLFSGRNLNRLQWCGVVWCDLGVILDANLTFNEHIFSTVLVYVIIRANQSR